jgi:hypothetical protein
MKIMIVRIVDKILNKIEFSSDYGHAIANWDGELPLSNREYYVEIGIIGKYVFNQNIIPSTTPTYGLTMHDDTLVMNCRIEETEEGVTTVRLGESIILLETGGQAFYIGTFVRIEMERSNITLYDMHLS